MACQVTMHVDARAGFWGAQRKCSVHQGLNRTLFYQTMGAMFDPV